MGKSKEFREDIRSRIIELHKLGTTLPMSGRKPKLSPSGYVYTSPDKFENGVYI